MKLYLLAGVYYEKQADVPRGQGKFETVEFPFAATPKADFVSWLNDQSINELAGTCDCSALMNGASDHSPSCPSYNPIGERLSSGGGEPLDFRPEPPPPNPVRDALRFREEVEDRWDEFPLGWKIDRMIDTAEECRRALQS